MGEKKCYNFAIANGKQRLPQAKRDARVSATKSKNGAVVQLVRILACHARGRGFESRPHRRGERKEQYGKLRFPTAPFFVYILLDAGAEAAGAAWGPEGRSGAINCAHRTGRTELFSVGGDVFY